MTLNYFLLFVFLDTLPGSRAAEKFKFPGSTDLGAQNFLRNYVISRQNSKLSSKGIKEGINEIIEEKKEAKEENDLILKQTRL